MSHTNEPSALGQGGKQDFEAGEYGAALEKFRRAAEDYAAKGDRANEAEQLSNVSVTLLQLGRAQEALEAVTGSEAVFAQQGDSRRQGIAMNNQAAALEALRRPDDAIAAYEKSAQLLGEAGEGALQTEALKAAAAIYLRRGRVASSGSKMLEALSANPHPNRAGACAEGLAANDPMSPRPSSFPPRQLLESRSARPEDREDISNLIFFESHVHKHLDWKAPLEWLGQEPFVVLQEGSRLSAALACPPDPPAVAWLRLFAFDAQLNGAMAWRMLWPLARENLEAQGCPMAAAIAIQRWLDPILVDNGFELVNHIVLMEMNAKSARPSVPRGDYVLRSMLPEDLPGVVEVDAAAFEPLWRNSLEALTHAFGQACYATVAEGETGLVGYQLSTGGAFGTHLARLAVSPAAQRHGLGAALIYDLIGHIPAGPRSATNAQHAVEQCRFACAVCAHWLPAHWRAIPGIRVAGVWTPRQRRRDREVRILQKRALDGRGLPLHYQAWEPDAKPRAVVALVHGLGEHVGRHAPLGEQLVRAGYALMGFDLRGHGRSGGLRGDAPSYATLLDDIDLLMDWVRTSHPRVPVFIYGHSLGGGLALNYVLRRAARVRGVIASSPWLRTVVKLSPLQAFLARTVAPIFPTLRQKWGQPAVLSRDAEVGPAFERDPLTHGLISARMYLECVREGEWALEHASEFPAPLLLMHGTADRLTSWEASREFARRVGRKATWRKWDGSYHELHNEPEGRYVISVIVNWIKRRLERHAV